MHRLHGQADSRRPLSSSSLGDLLRSQEVRRGGDALSRGPRCHEPASLRPDGSPRTGPQPEQPGRRIQEPAPGGRPLPRRPGHGQRLSGKPNTATWPPSLDKPASCSMHRGSTPRPSRSAATRRVMKNRIPWPDGPPRLGHQPGMSSLCSAAQGSICCREALPRCSGHAATPVWQDGPPELAHSLNNPKQLFPGPGRPRPETFFPAMPWPCVNVSLARQTTLIYNSSQ